MLPVPFPASLGTSYHLTDHIFFVFTIYLTPSPKNASFLRTENFVYFDHCCGLSD